MDLLSLGAPVRCEQAPGRRTPEQTAVNVHPLVATEKNTLLGRGVCRVVCPGGLLGGAELAKAAPAFPSRTCGGRPAIRGSFVCRGMTSQGRQQHTGGVDMPVLGGAAAGMWLMPDHPLGAGYGAPMVVLS